MQHKKTIRVLHLIEHLDVGGAERAAIDIIKALDSNIVHSIACVYRHKGAFGQELEQLGYPLYCINKSWLSDKLACFTNKLPIVGKLLILPIILLESLIFIFRLARLIRRHKIDIVHSHLYSANFWGRLCVLSLARTAKIITTEHNTIDYHFSWKINIANRLLAPTASRIVAVSTTVADSLLQMQWASPGQVQIIPNGIAIDKQTPVTKTPLPMTGKHPVIAIIAYLWPVKRHDLLFQAVKMLRDQGRQLSCLVIGDGPERQSLETLVKELQLENTIVFLGERYDVPALLSQIDIVVSTSDTEGLPVNLLEALAGGVAVVATDVGGTSEIIRHNDTGLLVEAGNVQAIAHAIGTLLEDSALAKQLGNQGRQLIRSDYSMAQVVQQWQNLYQEVLSKTNNPRL